MVTVGERLRKERLRKRLSLDDIARGTKIRHQFLEAIEDGQYNKLPSTAYAQGFVRNYAEYLGLSSREILALFRREFDEEKMYRVLPEGFTRQNGFLVKRFKIQQTAIGVVVLFIIILS